MSRRASVQRRSLNWVSQCARWGIVLCAVGSSDIFAASLEAPKEVLILESGDRLTGRSLSIDNGYLRWQLRTGEELMVPLQWIKHVDRDPQPELPPAPMAAAPPVPPANLPADPAPTVMETRPLSEPSSAAAEIPWIAAVPFYTAAHQGYLAASEGYTVFNDLASTWTRRINFGGQFIDGNAQNDVLNTQIEFENGTPKQARQLDVSGQWARSNNRQTANKWTANGNFDWPLDLEDKWIMFFSNKNEYDARANLDYRGTISTGIGYRFFNEGKKRLISRFGPAYTIEFFRDPYDHRESPDLFGELEIRWPLRKGTSVEQKMRVQPSILDFELVRVFSTTGFLVDLDDKDRWKLRLGLNYTYNSQPNPGRLPSDYISSVSLVYTRK
ncbi:MAG: DUF481 domain-containing protein [Planctomycetaceae bacterium]|nr:DUF481 domain-containing protein [Planctomycetaceae bacterium]